MAAVTTFQRARHGDEWYTPPALIARARAVLEVIDLDPASCERAQRVVQAVHFFSRKDNGLRQPWAGRIWLNPPFSSPLLARFVEKLLCEWRDSHIGQGGFAAALLLVPTVPEAEWCQHLLRVAPVCWLRRRVGFWHQHPGWPINGNPRGNAVFCFGDDVRRARFVEVFGELGAITRPTGGVA